MITQRFGYSFSENISGYGRIEYTDTQNYPKVTFNVIADHSVVKEKVISYLSKPRMFYLPDFTGMQDSRQKAVAPNVRIDYFQRALQEMNAATGIAPINQ